MENLPYYTVKHLKVYERQTDKSMALGYDVEPRQYVMDVILKDEYKQGYIGNVEAAGGTNERGLARAFLLGFADDLRLTLLGNVNNVNETRHIGETGHWTPEQAPRSMQATRSAAAEIDYHTKDDNLKETFRAEFTSTTDEQTMRQHYEQFIEGCRPTSFTEAFRRTGNRKLTLHNTLGLNKPFWMEMNADFNYAHRDASFNRSFDQWNDTLTASQRTVGMSEGTAWNGRASVNGAINIGGTKQHLDFSVQVRHDADQAEQASRYATQSYDRTAVQHNANDISNRTTSGAVRLSYEKKMENDVTLNVQELLTLTNQHTHDYLYHPDSLALASQLDALAAITDVSNSFDSHHRQTENMLAVWLHRPVFRSLGKGVPIGETFDQFSVRLEMPVRHESLNYQRGTLDTLARQDNVFLNVTGYYNFILHGDWRRANIGASHTSSAADLMDRITFRDDSQPLVVKLGNPDLRGKEESSIWASFTDGYSGLHHHSFNIFGGFYYKHRDVAQSVRYHPVSGVYTYQPMNIHGAYNAQLRVHFDQALDKQRYWTWQTDVDVKHEHNKDHAMLNSAPDSSASFQSSVNIVNTLTLHDGAHIQYRYKQLTLRAKGDIRYCLIPNPSPVGEGSEVSSVDSLSPLSHGRGAGGEASVLDFNYGLNASYTTPPLWGRLGGALTLAADATMFNRRGYGNADLNRDDFVVNASLSQPFAKGKFILRLEAFDLLHQLSPIDYDVNAQGRTITWYRSLPHYVMLHAVYHWNRNPKKK